MAKLVFCEGQDLFTAEHTENAEKNKGLGELCALRGKISSQAQ
jgi:hypothetical protein